MWEKLNDILGTKPFQNESRLFVSTRKLDRGPVKPLSIVKIVNKLFHASFSIMGLSSPALVDFEVSFVLEKHPVTIHEMKISLFGESTIQNSQRFLDNFS